MVLSPAVTLTITEKSPSSRGVPEIVPEEALSVRPLGRFWADQEGAGAGLRLLESKGPRARE